MARPAVPHCCDCKHLVSICFTEYVVIPRHDHKCTLLDKYMTGQDVRTSPSWCPLRHVWHRY